MGRRDDYFKAQKQRFSAIEHQAQVARGEILQTHPLDARELALFNEYYAVQLGAVQSRLLLETPEQAPWLNQGINREQYRFEASFAQASPEARAHVTDAIHAWKSKMDPSILGAATGGIYNKNDKNLSYAGVQFDGLAGAAAVGAGGFFLADKMGLSWVWKTLVTVVSAMAGALLANKATDKLMGKSEPEVPEIPEGTPHAPKPKQIRPLRPAPMGNPYASPSIPSPTFDERTGQINTGVANRNMFDFPNMPARNPAAYNFPTVPSGGPNAKGDIGAEYNNPWRGLPPVIPSADMPGTPLIPGIPLPSYNGPVRARPYNALQNSSPNGGATSSFNPNNGSVIINQTFNPVDVLSAPEGPQATPPALPGRGNKTEGLA